MSDLEGRLKTDIIHMLPKSDGSTTVYEAEPNGRLYNLKKSVVNGLKKRKGAILQVTTGVGEALLAYALLDYLHDPKTLSFTSVMGGSVAAGLAFGDIKYGLSRMFSGRRSLDYRRRAYTDASSYSCMLMELPAMVLTGGGDPRYGMMNAMPEKEPRK